MAVLQGWERPLVHTVRLAVVLWIASIVVFGPITLFSTVYGAVTGIEGAIATGVQVPVLVDARMPEGVGVPPVVDGTVRVGATVPLATLPMPAVIVGAVATALALVLTVVVGNRLYVLSRSLVRGRIEPGAPSAVRRLAVWILVMGAAYEVADAVPTLVASTTAADPAVHADLWPFDLISAASLAAVLVVVTAVLRSAAELQTDHDLTV